MSARSRSQRTETAWLKARRDRGAVLPLVLVLIVVGAFIVIPVTAYTVTVLRANRIEQEKTRNVEAAKGGVRLALRQPDLLFGDKDRANAGCPTDASLLLPAAGVVDDVGVSVACVPVDELSADTVFGFEVPVGAAQLQIAPDPGGFAGFTGVLASSGDAPPYPTTGTDPAWAWWQNYSWENPAEPTDIKTIWMPDLPTRPDVVRASDPFPMPSGFDCEVFLPGYYDQPVVIDTSGPTNNFYFASGVYYFEQPVTISGDVDVVVGQGLADFGVVNDCADDIQVGVNVILPPGTVYGIDGSSGGATWILGDEARVVIADAGGSPSVQFNQRYAPLDRGGWVNLMSVNGDWSHDNGDTDDDDDFEEANGAHSATNVNYIDRSLVRLSDDSVLTLGETGAEYTPSHPDLTDEARVPDPPADIGAEARLVGANGSIVVTFDGVEGSATNGAIVTDYEAGAQTGGATAPTPAPTSVCSTAGPTPSLVPAAEGGPGIDLWGDAHPENAADPDSYSCVISGLLPGSTYWVTARAYNDAGWSEWAAPEQVPAGDWSSAPQLAPSSEPTNVVVEASSTGPDEALVSWDAPATINGAPILGYDVEVSRLAVETFVGTTTTTSSTTSTTTTSTTTTSTTTSTTTTTTLPPPTADCGPPLQCDTIPSCPGGQQPGATYSSSSGEWEWSCAPQCDVDETLKYWWVSWTTQDWRCINIACDLDEEPIWQGFFGWGCRELSNPIANGGAPDTSCPVGSFPKYGYGMGFCSSSGPIPFRSPLSASSSAPVAAPSSAPVTGTTLPTVASVGDAVESVVAAQPASISAPSTSGPPTSPPPSSTTSTTLPTYLIEHEELLPGLGCSSVPHMGKTTDDAGLEWTPPPTECVVDSLAPLPAVDGDGFDNVGYRIRVYARTAAGRSAEALHSTPFMAVAGTPVDPAPLPPERVWFPYSPVPIFSIDASGGGSTVVDLPGYVSLPMGTVTVANPNGENVSINGGLAAGRIQINDSRSPLPYGYAPSVIMQRTIDLVATAGNITSIARVKINSDTSYGVVRWVTQ